METVPQLSILQAHHSLWGGLLLPSAAFEFGQSQQVFFECTHSLCKRNMSRRGQEPFAELSLSCEIVVSQAIRNVPRVEMTVMRYATLWHPQSRRGYENTVTPRCLFPFRWRLMIALYGSKSRPPLICQSQPKSIHRQHLADSFTRWELNGDFVITFAIINHFFI